MAMELCCRGATSTTTSLASISWSNSISSNSVHPTSVRICQPKRAIKVLSLATNSNNNGNGSTNQPHKGNQMTVSITGATGFIGKRLVQRLHQENHRVRVLTRSKSKAQLVFPVREFPGIVIAEEPEWKDCIRGSTAVVNLAGTPVSTRWSSEIKKEIMQSRINVTSKVVDLINNSQNDVPPKVLVSATAVGYYGSSETQVFDERSPPGNDYLARVCKEWEGRALKVNKDVRVALIRIGVVLGKDGGALGVINGTAPNPVRLTEMCEQLGNSLGRPSWLPVPEFALKAVLGEGASVVLEGQRVIPVRAKELGFSFKYPYVKDALKAVVCSDK
ncbi:epimerase family protein SDR39U1 homolog, chloroplastic-like isoform X2 [Papaver somniferum]|uniref:epimerase family protein SDR39U1 homolog, chloroplastic-like isoform X2 n=1 Tax=Papaver somniferum TaxID=3469 RepID=UPI000E6F67DA|nr:epimerase family protein SDR39U1 homolog, chloroplastic-like isoform X2 [Papaver somniferum]